MTGEIHKHPRRYPAHEGDKGQRLGGECNRTACTNRTATVFNKATYGLYCRVCAAMINRGNRPPLCVEVTEQLTIERMDQMAREDYQARYGSA